MDTNTNEIIIMTALLRLLKDDIVPGSLPKIECITGMMHLLAVTITILLLLLYILFIQVGHTQYMLIFRPDLQREAGSGFHFPISSQSVFHFDLSGM